MRAPSELDVSLIERENEAELDYRALEGVEYRRWSPAPSEGDFAPLLLNFLRLLVSVVLVELRRGPLDIPHAGCRDCMTRVGVGREWEEELQTPGRGVSSLSLSMSSNWVDSLIANRVKNEVLAS